MEKVQESYIIFKGENGDWQLLHPETGVHNLIINGEMVGCVSFDRRVAADFTKDRVTTLCNDNVFEAKKDLLADGYRPADIKKMKLRMVNTVELLES